MIPQLHHKSTTTDSARNLVTTINRLCKLSGAVPNIQGDLHYGHIISRNGTEH